MAHERIRHASDRLKRLLGFSPIVGIFGHRQVGKTTLLSRHVRSYATLDLRAQLDRAEADPQAFVSSATEYPFGIDEAQLAPALFPALKEHVRVHRRPGQFILSGSVRFTSRKAIRESLTGRIVHLELLPFTQAEIDHAAKAFGPVIVPELAVFVEVDDEAQNIPMVTGLLYSPVFVNAVCTVLTYPGTTMVFTFVPMTMIPWITSGLAKRSVTGRFCGTSTHCGRKAN